MKNQPPMASTMSAAMADQNMPLLRIIPPYRKIDEPTKWLKVAHRFRRQVRNNPKRPIPESGDCRFISLKGFHNQAGCRRTTNATAVGLLNKDHEATKQPTVASVDRSGSIKVLNDGRRQISVFQLPGDIFGLESGDEYAFSADAYSLFGPHPKMPNTALTRTDASDLAAYIKSLAK